jgi:hypothetical protein
MSKEASAVEKMSPATKDIISKVKQLVPPMLERFHKGKSLSHPHLGENGTDFPPQDNLVE